ncbi:MAG: SGNH/GDSL hydrolase family protein [Chitinophagaceae bacterium]
MTLQKLSSVSYHLSTVIFPLLLIFTLLTNKQRPDDTALANMTNMTHKTDTIHYLALGDSYTIGETVPMSDNFPSQTVQLLRKTGMDIAAPEIVAKTGWTTDELQTAISNHQFRTSYDFVTLLIGVNNQYRGRSVDDYQPQFEQLLKQAIAFAGGKADRVVVLSIPDWGVTPFAEGRDRKQIAAAIDAYNTANKAIALKYHIHYIDITPWTREAATDNSLLAADGLHLSGKEYGRWAVRVVSYFQEVR